MREYARQRGLRRLLVPVPLLTPRLSSLWLGLVTPLYARVRRKLVDSMRNPTVIRDPSALGIFPVHPRGVREAIARALLKEDLACSRTRWSDAVSSSGLREKYGGEFETTPGEAGGTEIRQTAIFDASGLFGLVYWYALYPLHRLVFAGMLRGIAARARESAV